MLLAHGRLKDFAACFASGETRWAAGHLHRSGSGRAARREGGRQGARRQALMALREINFDGIIGPSHNYAGLSFGNLASTRNAGQVSQPRAAALQGLDKMRANLALGLAQGIFLPQRRPNREWLASLGTTFEDCEPTLAAAAMSASSMWAANAATVSPAPDTGDGRCHLTVANLRTMPHRSHEWPGTLAQLRIAFADAKHFAVHDPVPPAFGDEGAANHMRLTSAHGEPGAGAVRLRRDGRRLSRAPASAGIQGDRPPPRPRSRADPVRRAIRGSDRCRRVPQRCGCGRERERPLRPRTRLRRSRAKSSASANSACPGSSWSKYPPRKCRSATRSAPICSTRSS